VGVPGFGVGLGVDLLLIELYLKLTPSVQILPSYPIAIFRFEAPVVASTLDGEAYIFIRMFVFDKKLTIVEWDGLSYEINFFPPLSAAFGASDQFKTSYYNNSDWSGSVPQVWEGLIYHDWGTGSPSVTYPDNFSVLWEGYYKFPGWEEYTWGDEGTEFVSTYTFFKDSDDQMTVWVDLNDNDKADDGETIFNNDFGPNSVIKSVPFGYHRVQVKYKEITGAAKAKLYWLKQNQFGVWYYNNASLSGDPVYFDVTESIDYDWKDKSPKEGFVNADNFSVKWEGNFDFPAAADYIFAGTADDGIRIYVDDVQVVTGSGAAISTGTKNLTKGSHKVRVEYYEYSGGASVKVWWAPKNTFVGRYYNNTEFKGTPSEVVNESGAILSLTNTSGEFYKNWTNRTNFTARFEGMFWFDAGDYDFVSIRDDGMKIWVDDDSLFAKWGESAVKAEMSQKTMTAGWHRIRIDYVNYGGPGTLDFKWTQHKNNEWTATYYSGTGTGKIAKDILKEAGAILDHNWGAGKTNSSMSDTDNFTVVFEGDFDFQGSPYLFTAGADDNITLWVDGIQILTGKGAADDFRESLPINAGTHRVKAEFIEYTGSAMVKVRWEIINNNTFYAQCFNNTSFNGAAAYYNWGGASSINKDWGSSGPCGNSDNFAMRWNGVFDFSSDGIYQFRAMADDKVTVWVDGVQVVNTICCGNYYYGTYGITAGPHAVKVEFVENSGNAKVQVDWSFAMSSGVCVYTGPNYSGTSQCFNDGSDIANLADYSLDDKIQSAKLIGGSWLLVFSDTYYGGNAQWWVNKDIPDMSNSSYMDQNISSVSSMSNIISSLKVRASSWNPGVAGVYENVKYGGSARFYTPGDSVQYNVKGGYSDSWWKDTISSVKIFGSAKLILYWSTNYDGSTLVTTSSIADLSTQKTGNGYQWSDQAGSLKVLYP